MSRLLISSGSPYEKPIGFSRAVRVGNAIAVAGTAPVSADGTTVGVGDVYAQTRRCLHIIEQAIIDAGGTLAQTVRTRVFLTDIARWQDAARAHGEVFGDIRPASTFVQVSRFIGADWLVEIEADCLLV